MSILDLARAVRRGWLIVVVFLLGGVSASLLWTQAQEPSYRADAELLVTAAPQESAASGQSANLLAQSRAQLLVRLVDTDEVLTDVQESLGFEVPLAELRAAVSATADMGSNFVVVTAVADSSRRAADVATAVSAALQVQGESIDSAGAAEGSTAIRIEETVAPRPPLVPFAPDPARAALIGSGLGVAFALVILLLDDALRRRIRTAADAAELGLDLVIIALRRHRIGSGRGAPTETLRGFLESRFGSGAHLGVVDLGSGAASQRLVEDLEGAYTAFGEAFERVPIADPTSVVAGQMFAAPTAPGAVSASADVRQAQVLPATEGYRCTFVLLPPLGTAPVIPALVARPEAVLLVLYPNEVRPAQLALAVERLRAAGARQLLAVLSGVPAAEEAIFSVGAC